jgi:hypothetical protein
MNEEIKSPNFDVCNGLKNVTTKNGTSPTIEPGMHVTLSYKKHLVTVRVDPKDPNKHSNHEPFLGRIVSTNAIPATKIDIHVGDWVSFKYEHVCSIGRSS